jgi:uncharacterized protein
MQKTPKTTVKRAPKRGIYNAKEIYEILDNDFLCHVALVHNGAPVVIPTLYGREDDCIYIHGASVSRLITETEKGIDVSVSVTTVKGLVLARSAFHHSMNYESVVLFGKGVPVPKEDKLHALKVISDHVIKHRWEEVRLPNKTEMKATMVIKIQIAEASGKRREGKPIDEKADYDLDIWAGVVPVETRYGSPIIDNSGRKDLPVPKSVKSING